MLLTPVTSEAALIMTMRELLLPKEATVSGDCTALREHYQEDWRMLSLAVRLRCSSSMQGPKGHGEPEAQRQAADTRWAF